MSNKLLTLVSASVERVLGEYDHLLTFPDVGEFAIIYGPNGVGKTKFLEIVHAISRLDGRTLSALPFTIAELKYSDGSVMRVSRSPIAEGDIGGKAEVRRELSCVLEQPDMATSMWSYTGDHFEDWLVDKTPWRPLDGGTWEDRRDGELATLDELGSRYPEGQASRQAVPDAFRNFADRLPSFLIETQRLRIEQFLGRRAFNWQTGGRPKQSSRINEHAAKMRSLVNDAQTEHSTITQQLDRTFPNRVLESKAKGDGGVRKRYNEQNSFRSRLGRVASVRLDDALSLPDRKLLEWELQLLSLYLDDADKKLAPFETLLSKIELLEEIINSRLLKKKLQVTAGAGLTVLHEADDRPIDLDALSSGEQHEIILMFDLLFNVPAGALVLIDEPEISLHVVWQLAFIPDVQRIAELAGFRFIVATHSPQIINDAWSRATRLGPPEVAFS